MWKNSDDAERAETATSTVIHTAWKRIGRRLVKWAAWGLVAFATLYGIAWMRYFAARPWLSHDYSQELLARTALPEDQRSYSQFRDYSLHNRKEVRWEKYPKVFADAVMFDIVPGEDAWPEAERFCRDCVDDIAMVRRAAVMPGFGAPMSNAYDSVVFEEMIKPNLPEDSPFKNVPINNPALVEIEMVHMSWTRGIVRALLLDSRVAAAEGDTDRSVGDMVAVLGISEQFAKEPFSEAMRLRTAIRSVADEEIRRVLTVSPDLFSEDQLKRLAAAVQKGRSEGRQFPMETEQIRFNDWLQRCYTRDGSGDGRLTPRGAMAVEELCEVDLPEIIAKAWKWRALQPLLVLGAPSRKDMNDEFERMFAAALRDQNVRPYLGAGNETREMDSRAKSSRLTRIRYAPALIYAERLANITQDGETIVADADATLVSLGVEIYRRRVGAYPTSLDQLVPDVMAAVPIDGRDGKPLKYSVRDGKPVVYSSGPDGVDDGGARTCEDRAMYWGGLRLRVTAPGFDYVYLPRTRSPKGPVGASTTGK